MKHVLAAIGVVVAAFAGFRLAGQDDDARLRRIEAEVFAIHREVGEISATQKVILQGLRLNGGVPVSVPAEGYEPVDPWLAYNLYLARADGEDNQIVWLPPAIK